MRPKRATRRASIVALVLSVALGSVAGTSLVVGATGLDPSNVVLVFDVSNSILLSTDGTNGEFADALDGIADRIEVVTSDLAAGNAEVSFVVFGRTAVPYPANCARLDLHDDPAAIARFEQCLRSIAAEYRAGAKAPVRQRVNTQDTDHVAALVEAANLLPDTSTRSAVIFFTDGKHDPPGTARDNENVVARVTPAFAGKTPLAVLPVGLGSGAGAFETELTAIYQAFFRDMEPCEGRASFSWPKVVFPSADAAGTAVALALQEVTCSFTVAPTPAPTSAPTQPPATVAPSATSAPPVLLRIPDAPSQPRVEPLDASARLSMDPPAAGGSAVVQYVVACANGAGQAVEAAGPPPSVVVTGLANGQTYQCVAYAENSVGRSPASPPSASFSPCNGLFDCNPWTKFALAGLVLAALLGAIAVFVVPQYRRRSRVWVTAQVDGGENRPLGWGPELGIRLVEDEAGWFATALPPEGAAVRVRFERDNRFMVTSGTRIVHVHQGDPTPVRDEGGTLHQVILRRYRDRPNDRKAAPAGPDSAGSSSLGARLPGRGEDGANPPGPEV
jgi:Fibronectin type III domain.